MGPTLLVCTIISLIGVVVSDLTSLEIAQWDRPRGAVIRHDIWLEGGWIQIANWTGGDDGKWDGRPTTFKESYLFKLSLNRSFDISDASSPARFQAMATNTVPTEWLDGFMFADYDEFVSLLNPAPIVL